jgi:hypothetical protein
MPRAYAAGVDTRTVVLVEGTSDKIAVETLAERHGRDLKAEGISVLAMGGAQAVGRHLQRLVGLDVRLAGLCDVQEIPQFSRGLERAGLGPVPDREALERLGFHVCVRDLEDELMRALGVARVQEVVEEHGDLGPFQTLQKQVEWRGRPEAEQLRRFMGSGGRRKQRYARFLVEALEPGQVPRPLARLLEHVMFPA